MELSSKVANLSPPVIEVQDVDFKYNTGPVILKNVNFGLDQSSRICIVGPNGAGDLKQQTRVWIVRDRIVDARF